MEVVLIGVKGLKKPTLDTWCKPHSRVRKHPKLQQKKAELRDTVRFFRMGNGEEEIVLDRFLQSDRGPRKSPLSESELTGCLFKMLDRERGFRHIDAIAGAYGEVVRVEVWPAGPTGGPRWRSVTSLKRS
jgi:hypothetical protein